jgi:hypothetical protein
VTGSYERCNETLVSVSTWNSLYQLRDDQVLKKDF